MKHYIEVKCSDRLPESEGIYLTDVGRIQFNRMPTEWTFKDNYGETQQIEPELWLEDYVPKDRNGLKIRGCFLKLRHDDKHHLGLGDIHLTIGMQEEIIKLFESVESDAEAEFYKWWGSVTLDESDKGAALVGFVESYHWFK